VDPQVGSEEAEDEDIPAVTLLPDVLEA